jgi:hypothetical protein
MGACKIPVDRVVWRGNFYVLLTAINFILVVGFQSEAHCQHITVSGRIVDQDSLALAGVNILLKGTPHGTVTDLEGRFSITVPNKNSALIFALNGYKGLEHGFSSGDSGCVLEVTLINQKFKNRTLKSRSKVVTEF